MTDVRKPTGGTICTSHSWFCIFFGSHARSYRVTHHDISLSRSFATHAPGHRTTFEPVMTLWRPRIYGTDLAFLHVKTKAETLSMYFGNISIPWCPPCRPLVSIFRHPGSPKPQGELAVAHGCQGTPDQFPILVWDLPRYPRSNFLGVSRGKPW